MSDGTSAEPYYPAGYPSGYTWAHIVCASVVVTIVMLIIVFGNFLVMWAIVTDRNLKGTQNLFIGSLALADFLLGLVVVPFSLANELMGYWYFGTVFCELWKATDVLLCTASITSLCLISLDRYWSITKAIHYSRQRTPKRAAVMIFIVWFVSAAICIPPLIGWKQPAPDSDWPLCALSEDIGYVLYSSMGSFYIPAFIMVFVYFKIYEAAKARARKNVTKAPRGAVSEKSEQKNSTESSGTEQHCSQYQQHQQQEKQQTKQKQPEPVQPVTPEKPQIVHPLQSPSVEAVDTPVSECKCTNEIAGGDVSWTPAPTSEDELSRHCAEFRSRSLSLPCSRNDELAKLISTDSDSCDALAGPALNLLDRSRFGFYSSMPTTTTDTDSSVADLPSFQQQRQQAHQLQQHQQAPGRKSKTQHGTFSQSTAVVHSNAITSTPDEVVSSTGQDNGTIQQFKIMEPKQNGNVDKSKSSPQRVKDSQSPGVFGSIRNLFQRNNGKVESKPHHAHEKKKKGHKKDGKDEGKNPDFFSAERQKRKIAKARERRATLVLGLVMAAFILCWLPFFALYVVSAFCVGCIPPMVFTVFFWIGYCNSALNPIIYTVFNRDFRRAFQRILFGRKRGRR
nr:hypothetical protein BaRGS_033084 [Batillaria attramentaria]KAG5700504.1 hypothetical protein BaRGS_013991 [Batillaria attramentaria]